MRALLLPGAGRLPFTGHLRMRVGDAHVAARVAHGSSPVEAWAAVCALHAAWADAEPTLEALLARADRDREALGPAKGEDLALLLVQADGRHEAHGLAEVHSLGDARVGLVEGDPAPAEGADLVELCG